MKGGKAGASGGSAALRLALHLDLAATRRVAADGLDSPAAHASRHAAWVLSAEHLRDRPSIV